MSNKITLQVDVIQKIKERIDQTKQSYERIGRSGAFEKRGGEEASTRIKGSFAIIDELLKKTELTETEFGNLAKAIQTVFASLTNFATKMGKTSNEIQKIQQSLSDIQEKRGKAEESLTLSKTVKTDTYAALADEMAKKGLFKINKEGQLSKIAIKKPETLERLYRSDKSSDAVGYKDASGNIVNIKHDDDIRQAIQNYNEASQAVSKWESSIVALEESLNELQKRLEKIAERVKDPGVQEIVGLNKTETAIKDIVFGVKRSHDDEIAAKKNAESNEKLNLAYKEQDKSLTKVLLKNTLYRYALRFLRKAISDAVGTIKELDKSLTEQAMVIGKTRKETYVLLKTYQEMATQLGTISKEVSEVMTEFVRQGKSIADSLKLTEAAISSARVAGISAKESIDYLTTALNGFQLSAEKAMEVSDKFAAIAARSATDYNEIATALSKVAAQAHLAGISIDQTTALLATGIEATREAPETIGTALKTIVARMREMSDYGKTLDGESDINNVETQLAYVGIQLRNVNGELRSTGDVFDDLGKKWKTLDTNQQAAIARALAGTRQQARLIAMMANYERVVELQQISEESAGTTVAQMGTYLQGLDAAINRLNTTWEKIVTTISDSDIIIGIIDLFTRGLELVNDILSSSFGMVAVLTTIGLIGVGILARKKVEWEMQKEILRSTLEEKKAKLEKAKLEKEELKNKQKVTLEIAKQAELQALSALSEARRTGNAEEIAAAEMIYNEAVSKTREAKAALALTDAEILDINAEMNQNSLQQLQYTRGIGSVLSGLLAPVLALMNIWRMITVAIKAANAATAVNATVTEKATAKTKLKAMWEMVASASAKPIVGWIIGAAILAAFGIAAAVGIAKYKKVIYEKSAEGTAKAVNDLSKEIFDLNRRVEELDKGLETFKELDNQIIKTKEDIEAMGKALDEAADKLSTTKEENLVEGLGVSEKEYYDSLQTEKARYEFLVRAQEAMEDAMTEKRAETLKKINRMSKKELDKFLTEPDFLSARDAIYALNNKAAYDYIDALKERNIVTKDTANASKALVKNILEELDAFEAWTKANNTDEIQEIVDTLTSLTTSVKGVNTSIAEILDGDDYSLKHRVEAFKELTKAFEGNEIVLESIEKNYSQYRTFAQLSNDTLDFTEKLGLTNEKLNDLYKGYKALHQVGVNITQEEYQSRFFDYLEKLTELQGNVAATTKDVFGDILSNAKNYEEVWSVLINNLTNLISVGTLNMGQNIDKFEGKINSFYSTAIKWREISETDRTKFLDENKELFAGKEAGDALLRAFQSGNFTMIEEALASNPTLMKERERLLGQITQELKNELAREGDAYNAAYIEFLKQQKAYFEDSNKIYRANLEERLKQEEAAIERYKELLEKQQEALVGSLEKKRDAYQKYFDAINQQAEDEEYEEQTTKLIENISKLSATSNADASKMRKELSQELQQLEKERLKTLRERAQEQVIQNIEEELKKIQDKFDKLIESNKDLLDAFLESVKSPETLLAEKISQTAISDGLTKTGFESFLVELRNDWGAFLDTVKWDELSVNRGENAGGNLILNIAGEEINLSSEDSKVFADAISEALRQTGYR